MIDKEIKEEEFGKEYEYTIKGKNITIENYIGKEAKVIIPGIVEDKKVTKIASEAFEGKNLKEIVMPNTVKEVGKFAFASNMSLEKIELSSNLKFMPQGMLAFCSKLKELSIPLSVKSIEKNSLDYVKLKKIFIPNSVNKINNKAFGKKLEEMGKIIFEVEKGSIADQILSSKGLNVKYIK